MQHIITLFNYNLNPPLPLISIVIDEQIRFFTFYIQGTGLRLHQIETQISEFRQLFDKPTCVNDFKSHVAAFEMQQHTEYEVYDYGMPQMKIRNLPDLVTAKKSLARLGAELSTHEPDLWQNLFANAGVVYSSIEKTGIRDGYKRMPVIYSQDTFTGRSKTLGYAVQGATAEHDIRSTRDEYNVQIQFDWLAADMRMAAYMSCDKLMTKSYETSDPYTCAAEYFNASDMSRDECKIRFLRAIYSLNMGEPILELYPEFKRWMQYRIDKMREDKCLDTVLGRLFFIEGNNQLSVFNSQFQGSVAHAMQAVLTRVFKLYKYNFITEMHDALIMCCSEDNVQSLINTIVPIMLNPLEGYVESPPRMPVRVSVGNKWRNWNKFRTYR